MIWADDEIQLLKINYPISLGEDLASLFPNRSNKSISRKAEELKLHKTEEIKFLSMSLATRKKWRQGKLDIEKIKIAFKNGKKRDQRKEKNPNWKGGNRPRRKRDCIEYKQWRDAIFQRDNYICGMCEKRGGQLEAHHIKIVAKFPELIYDINNGITLCAKCHKSIRKSEEKYEKIFQTMNELKNKHPKLEKIKSEFVGKGWGTEEILVNNEEFCAKILRFNKGSKFSYHFHKEKREVFYVVRGYLKVIGINTENAEEYIMFLQKGEILDIPRGAIHRLEALEESEIWEISTTHRDEDSYRVRPGDSQTKK